MSEALHFEFKGLEEFESEPDPADLVGQFFRTRNGQSGQILGQPGKRTYLVQFGPMPNRPGEHRIVRISAMEGWNLFMTAAELREAVAAQQTPRTTGTKQ